MSDEFKWYSLQAASTVNGVSTFQGSNKLVSFYGRLNYNYADRILVTGTVRRDGSSRFGEGNKWGTFPSGSVAWRISKEKFFNVDAISDLKLRVSYGLTGNQEIGNYPKLHMLTDSRTAGPVLDEDINYFKTQVMPQMEKIGIRYLAVVMPSSKFTRLSIKEMEEGAAVMKVRNFESIREARSWLRKMTTL